jgi:exosortase
MPENRKLMNKRVMAFVAVVLGSVLLNLMHFKELLTFSLENKYSSHVLLIPFLSAGLIYFRRSAIFSNMHSSIFAGGATAAFGAIFSIWLNLSSIGLSASDALSAKALAIVIFWIGTFLLFFGVDSFQKAIFPLLFLLFMIPIPETLLETVVAVLQRGSAEMTELLFKITGTPYYRNGMAFVLPGISIEIAAQCSGIRSSLALLISALLAADLMLQTVWRKLILILFAIPLAMFKNAVRIAMLSLLSIHIDKGFIMNSDLHQEGGIVFYLLAVLLMLPVLSLLRRSERKTDFHKKDDLKVV